MRPTRTLVRCVAGFALAGVVVALLTLLPQLAAAGPWIDRAFGTALFVFVCAALVDAALPGWRAKLAVSREPVDGLPVSAWSEVHVVVRNEHARALEFELFDGVPSDFESEHLPRRVRVEAASAARVTYSVRPRRRGRSRFSRCELLRRSQLGLWDLRQFAGEAHEVVVLPNFRPIVRYALLAVANRLEQMGIRKKPRRGLGKSFHQLREYREGDLLQQVDWKATARRRQLVSREYEEERDQQIVLLLDCGQRMRSIDGELSHFDHCLNALLLLAHVALRQGDSVAVMAFGGSERWLPPVKGVHGVQAVLRTVFDLETTDAPSDFAEAARRVLTLQRRRSLVVWLTNLRGEDAGDLLPAVASLRARHVSLVASLREAFVDDTLASAPTDFESAVARGAAAIYAEEREQVVAALRSAGVRALDLRASELAVALANEYLDVKSAGAL